MRNLLLIARREYLERVRTRSFLLTTLGLPLLMAAFVLVPQKLASVKTQNVHHVAVAASQAQLAAAVKRHLLAEPETTGIKYNVEVVADTGEQERKELTDRVSRGDLDAYIWLPDSAIAERKATYSGRELSDFMDVSAVRTAITRARMEQELAAYGVSPEIARVLFQEVKLDTVRIARGKESRTSTMSGFFTAFSLVMLLYMVLLLYGVAVMRSVLEEKTSRVLEVLLSSVTPRDLMSGKILGVAAVGTTQILIWILLLAMAALPAAAASGALKNLDLAPLTMAAFPVFFLLGFLLYSAIYAAIGAMVNSEQEGQQLQILGMSPLILAISMMMLVLRQPNSGASIWASMVPFLAPILMYMRIAVQPPPMWQIALSIGLLIGTIWAVMVLCGRIYRVGILMYGKRPTLPEIMKWVKYAKA